MQIITMYLPQFHRVKENDEWWGEGYTDWTSAKNAKPLFEGHYQPHLPLKGNYYDLMDINSLKWQASLMKKYGIDAQCIYHYWFENGRQILEKPAELLKDNKDIDMNYCFCWANKTWARSWSNIKGATVWSDKFENGVASDDNGILLKQSYGNTKDWEEHYNYLISFFRDERYVKKDNKPVFVIYNCKEIKSLNNMMDCWNKLAIKDGFAGVYVIGAGADDNSIVNKRLQIAPGNALPMVRRGKKVDELRILDYKEVWDRVISKAYLYKDELIGGFVGFDDTPRRGNRGMVIDDLDVATYRNYLQKLLCIAEFNNNDFVFINAWNEWGEGMHLEPDEKNGFSFLEATRDAKLNYYHLMEEIEFNSKFYDGQGEEIKALNSTISQYGNYWKVMNIMLECWDNEAFLFNQLKGVPKRICIYGLGMLGKHFISLIEKLGQEIQIVCCIDLNRKEYKDYKVISSEDQIPEADLVINTVVYDVDKIRKQLLEHGAKEVLSIMELFD